MRWERCLRTSLETRKPRVMTLGRHRNQIGRQAHDGQFIGGHSPFGVDLNGTAAEGDVTGGGDARIERIRKFYFV